MEHSKTKKIEPDATVQFSSQVEAEAAKIFAQRKKDNPNYKGNVIIAFKEFDFRQDDGYVHQPMV